MDIENVTPADLDFLEEVQKTGLSKQELIERARKAIEEKKEPPPAAPAGGNVAEVARAEAARAANNAIWQDRIANAIRGTIAEDSELANEEDVFEVISERARVIATAAMKEKPGLSDDQFLAEVRKATKEAIKHEKTRARRIAGVATPSDVNDGLEDLVEQRSEGVATSGQTGGGAGSGSGDTQYRADPLPLGGLAGKYPSGIELEERHAERLRRAQASMRRGR